jgi:hypothetical protein
MDDNQSINEYPAEEGALREYLNGHPPPSVAAMTEALRHELSATAATRTSSDCGVLIAARMVSDLRRELDAVRAQAGNERRANAALFQMIEDHVRLACREEIAENVGDELVDRTDVRAIVRDMIANDDVAIPVEGLTGHVRDVIGDMISGGELAINVEVEAYAELT